MPASIVSNCRRLVIEEGGPNWKSYGLIACFMAITAATTGAAAWLLRDVINQVLVDKNEAATYWLGATIVAIYTIKGLAAYGQQVMLAIVGNRIVASIQMRIFNHLLRQGLPYFTAAHSTQFLAQQSFISSSARGALDLLITTATRDLLSVIALASVMLATDPVLSFGALLAMPLALLGVRKLVKRVKTIITREYASYMEIMQTTSETVQGIRVVKGFQLEDFMRARMLASVNAFARSATRLANIASRSAPLMDTLAGFAVAFVIVYGGYRVIHQGRTSGDLVAFIFALLMAYEPAKRIAKFNIDLNGQMVGVGMMYDFLDAKADETDDSHLPDLKVTHGEIAFDNVSFAYRAEDPVLDGICFVAKGGLNTALIGPSGSGKSTIFNLVQRFYRPRHGTITIDGQDIASINRASLRANIATVSQDTFLFQGSIRDNIALGQPGASQAQVDAACRAAHVDDFVRELSGGYDAPVGEHGLALSGGQRQRVAIARAMLKNAPIVLLDEATSALDIVSERFVRDGLKALCAGRTVLIIAHRQESYAHADEIIAMEAGRILQAA